MRAAAGGDAAANGQAAVVAGVRHLRNRQRLVEGDEICEGRVVVRAATDGVGAVRIVGNRNRMAHGIGAANQQRWRGTGRRVRVTHRDGGAWHAESAGGIGNRSYGIGSGSGRYGLTICRSSHESARANRGAAVVEIQTGQNHCSRARLDQGARRWKCPAPITIDITNRRRNGQIRVRVTRDIRHIEGG